MVEKFKKILEKMTAAQGSVTLFAIVKMDDLTGKWSVIVSAPWAQGENHNKAFGFILSLIKEVLNDEEQALIARIAIFDKAEHLIEMLLQYKKGTVLENQKVNGNMVYSGYVLESNQSI